MLKRPNTNRSMALALLIFGALFGAATVTPANAGFIDRFIHGLGLDRDFHEDADVIRLENLIYWSGLIEEYYEINGVYPLAELLDEDTQSAMVRIATQTQRQFYDKDSPHYRGKLDFNQQYTFQNIHVITLIWFLRRDLDREILEKYDVQKVPVHGPVWLHYFVFPDGYLLWTPCDTCEASEVTYPVGQDPTYQSINVGSPSLADQDDRFFLRSELLENPVFQDLINRPLHKELYIRNLVEQYHQHWQIIYQDVDENPVTPEAD